MKLMYEVFVDGDSLGLFADANEAQRRIEEELTNDPTMPATIKLTYACYAHEAVKPKRLSVADTGWRDEYRGMWAEHKVTNKVFLMLDDDGERVRCCDNHSNMWGVKKEALRPRYDLAPVDFTPHPAYLETLEDYQNAPEDTIVFIDEMRDEPAFVKTFDKKNSGWQSIWSGENTGVLELAGECRRVLYWPKEA